MGQNINMLTSDVAAVMPLQHGVQWQSPVDNLMYLLIQC